MVSCMVPVESSCLCPNRDTVSSYPGVVRGSTWVQRFGVFRLCWYNEVFCRVQEISMFFMRYVTLCRPIYVSNSKGWSTSTVLIWGSATSRHSRVVVGTSTVSITTPPCLEAVVSFYTIEKKKKVCKDLGLSFLSFWCSYSRFVSLTLWFCRHRYPVQPPRGPVRTIRRESEVNPSPVPSPPRSCTSYE